MIYSLKIEKYLKIHLKSINFVFFDTFSSCDESSLVCDTL